MTTNLYNHPHEGCRPDTTRQWRFRGAGWVVDLQLGGELDTAELDEICSALDLLCETLYDVCGSPLS